MRARNKDVHDAQPVFLHCWDICSKTNQLGLRFDAYHAYSSGSQLSPRLNAVWQAAPDTTVHAGYSRYFTPPPFELIGSETFTKFAGTTALPPGSNTEDAAPIAERANYYDFGVQQKLFDRDLALGVDSYYEQAVNLIDEGPVRRTDHPDART